ncbi:MAG TPA: tetratricopeptide repeat protein, partial [Ohtaekwangia sp.]|nr:tetratricopeptide repeat protein [Ohtaekwangia sp.]
IESNTPNVFATGDEEGEDAVDWYFGNPSAMSLGQSEFKRVWGDVPLEDNWRRSLRSTLNTATRSANDDPAAPNPDEPVADAGVPADPVAVEFDRISKQIPRTQEQRDEALKKIETAYFNLGDIYYFKLQEKDNAVSSYTTLLRRFPGNEHEPEVLYKLYLIFKDSDPGKAEFFAGKLKEQYPASTFTKILLNPNYLAESSLAIEKQKVIYKTAYELYKNQDYDSATQTIDEAIKLGQTTFVPTLELLKILIVGETENINQYQFLLDQFIAKYPTEPLADYAKKLLATSRNFQQTQEKQKGIRFIQSLNEPHYFVMVYRIEEKLNNTAVAALEKFNQANFKELQLKTSNLVLNDEYTLTLVADLPQVRQAMAYIETFNDKLPALGELRNHKFNTFVITKDNFDIFYRTKGLDEYLKFFEKNYPPEIQ